MKYRFANIIPEIYYKPTLSDLTAKVYKLYSRITDVIYS